MVEKELLEKQESIDLCLWKFLTYILNKYEGVLRRMHNCYSDKEKRTFLYNCAINTIDEFLEYKEKTLPPAISSEVIINTFKENIKLEHYESIKLDKKVPKKTELILFNFKFLKYELSHEDKTELINHVESILTSTF